MDGLMNVLGLRTIPLRIGSADYRLAPMTLAEHAERETLVVSLKTDPRSLLIGVQNWPASADRQPVIDKANDQADTFRRASSEDVAKFDSSFCGVSWRLARALRKHHPDEATSANALSLIQRAGSAGWEAILRALLLSEERDLLAKIYLPGSGGARDAGDCGRIPWANLLRSLSEKFGWTWDTISEMTLYSALAANGGICPEDGQFLIDDKDHADFQAWAIRRKLMKAFL